jgi:Tfp pilus assembly protein PilO
MDVALLIPILALCIPVVVVVSHGLQKVMKLRIEEARLRGEGLRTGDGAELQALRSEVADLRHELAEVEERLDFTERALVQHREAARLPGNGAPS